MKLRHIIVLIIFILINALILLTFIPEESSAEEDDKQSYIPYLEAAKVKNDTASFDLISYGTVSSFRSVDIASEVQGKLSDGKYKLKPGVKFNNGDLLFSVNDVEARYSLRSRKSTFINLIANILPDIKVDYPDEYDKWRDYMESVRLNESLPRLPLWKTKKEKIFLSTRNILTEYFAIKSLEEQLKKYTVYAPFSGMITEVFLPDQSIVSPGARVIHIIETRDYKIPVSIPVGRMEQIAIGTLAKIYATSGTYKGQGEIVRISELIDKATQSVTVFIRPLSENENTYVQGEYVEVKIAEKGIYNGLRLPHAAVNDSNVLIYKKDSILKPKKISVLDKNENGVFVSGLKNNQIVITEEVGRYTDSTKYGIVLSK